MNEELRDRVALGIKNLQNQAPRYQALSAMSTIADWLEETPMTHSIHGRAALNKAAKQLRNKHD